MRARHRVFVVFVLGALIGWPGPIRSVAQQSTPTPAPLFSTMRWRSIGPERGGRSIASSGVVGRPDEYYFGAAGGGLWKTVDGGTTWSPVTDGQIKSSSVGAVAVSESNPDIVYIGMGEACLRGNIMQGDGIYKSTDAGKTWKNVGLADSQVVSRIRVHPKNPDLVYAAVFGHPAAPHDTRGVYRSKDGGQTWQRVLFRDNKTGAIDLVVDRNNPNVLYAALWEAYRVAWQMSSGGPGSGLFKSTDGGDTWTELTRNPGMPAGVIGRIGVAVSGADSNRVFAIVENQNGGVLRSDDGGATWTKVNEERNLRQRAFYYTHIFADPRDRDTVYVLNTGFYKSTDGGKKYTTLRPPHGDNHDLWIDPTNPKRLINSNDGGANVSLTGGATWTDQDFATAQFYHVATTKDFPYHVCGAQQDNSTACITSEPQRGRATATLYPVGGGESGYIAPDPTNPDIFYAGSQGALVTRFDRKTGQIRDVQVYPRFFSGEPSSALKERWQWTFPIVFSPRDPHILYVTSQHVWKSTNQGQSWESISPDLTRADPKTLGLSGGPITGDMNGPEIYATVFALAPSPLELNLLWAGSDDGLIHVTRDGGSHWENITPRDLPEFSRVSIIDASAHDPSTAYVAAKRYQLDDRQPYIYRTHDFGKSWTRIVNGIRSDDYVHVVREDPRRKRLLYAGTEHGMYVSFDDGDNWQSLSLNLPDTQIADLVVQGNDLVAATHGRSFWILDDITPLREYKPEISTTDAYLFTPSDAVRGGGQSAAIYYYLKTPAQKVTLDVLDANGQVVRTYATTREEDEKAAREPTADEGGFGQQPRRQALTNAGLTR
ncbi:MAG: VPS10 domain-containing protein, partial [Acidobacteriota bacterium]